MEKEYVRQHYEYAKTGVPSQECEKPKGGSKGADWDKGSGGASGNAPHRVEKSKR